MRCRLVARDFKPRRDGSEDDLFAVMRSLEAKKALFAHVAGVREKRREQDLDKVKLMFVDVKKTHFKCKMRRGRVGRVARRIQEMWEVRQKLKIWLYGMSSAASGRVGLRKKIGL